MPLPRPIFSGSFRVYSLIWDAPEIFGTGRRRVFGTIMISKPIYQESY